MVDKITKEIINKPRNNQQDGNEPSRTFANTPLAGEQANLHQQLIMSNQPRMSMNSHRTPQNNNEEGNSSILSSAWNGITHNAISGGLEFMGGLSNAQRGITNIAEASPFLTRAQSAVRGIRNLPQRVASSGARGANTIASSSRLSGISQTASRVLAPLGVVSNSMALYDSVTGSGNSSDDNGLQRGVDSGFNAAGLVSAGIGTAALAGEATVIGASAAALAPVAAVTGAAAGGYALGQFADEQLGISDRLSSGMVAADGLATSGLRMIGAYDESRPAYTQTLGYRLGEVLPSWMQ